LGWAVLTLVAPCALLARLIVDSIIVEAWLTWVAHCVPGKVASAHHSTACSRTTRSNRVSCGPSLWQLSTLAPLGCGRAWPTPPGPVSSVLSLGPGPRECYPVSPESTHPRMPAPLSPSLFLPDKTPTEARSLTWLAIMTAPKAIGVGVPNTVELCHSSKHKSQQKGCGPPSLHTHPHLLSAFAGVWVFPCRMWL
jgi:hypothetical protein